MPRNLLLRSPLTKLLLVLWSWSHHLLSLHALEVKMVFPAQSCSACWLPIKKTLMVYRIFGHSFVTSMSDACKCMETHFGSIASTLRYHSSKHCPQINSFDLR